MKTKNAVPRLPKLASELVAVARRDLIAVRRKKNTYAVNMGVWHSHVDVHGNRAKQCSVCQAGALMARTLGADPSNITRPRDYVRPSERKSFGLKRLNQRPFRKGQSVGDVAPSCYLHTGQPIQFRGSDLERDTGAFFTGRCRRENVQNNFVCSQRADY